MEYIIGIKYDKSIWNYENIQEDMTLNKYDKIYKEIINKNYFIYLFTNKYTKYSYLKKDDKIYIITNNNSTKYKELLDLRRINSKIDT